MLFISPIVVALLSLSTPSIAGSAIGGWRDHEGGHGHDHEAVIKGFNSGNTLTDNTPKNYSDFLQEFQAMHSLPGTSGFNVVRLYTNIQASPSYPTEPLSAFKAAIDTNTKMLLGMWASGTPNITFELDALSETLDKYGSAFSDLVVGISVGSEDLYRTSVKGYENNAGIGATPSQIVQFVKDTRQRIAGTLLADKPVGHVDTWMSFTNSSNEAVIDAVDWLGMDVYSFYEKDPTVLPRPLPNTYENAVPIFQDTYHATVKAAKGKPVYVTETGWPYLDTTGVPYGEATASQEYETGYWQNVGCDILFDKINTFWYTFRDADIHEVRKFAIIHDEDGQVGAPRFNLTCDC